MASLLSFAWRKNRQSPVGRHAAPAGSDRNQLFIDADVAETHDPWGLGVATSTSSAESIDPNGEENGKIGAGASVHTFSQKAPPSTPEGLRPRKSVHKLRQELLGYQPAHLLHTFQHGHLAEGHLMPAAAASSPAGTNASPSSHFPTSLENVPSEIDHEWQSPQMTLNSAVLSHSAHGNDCDCDVQDDYDIVSMVASPSLSVLSESCRCGESSPSRGRRLVAVSPDLQPGKAKTAVGALLAVTSVSKHGKMPPIH